MLKILLSAVGKRDPFNDRDGTPGSILSVCIKLKPDHIFLFPTAEQPDPQKTSTEDNAHLTRAEILKKSPDIKVFIRPLDIPDPTDYKHILSLFKDEFDQIRTKYQNSQVEYHLSISSGTSQIQASLLLLINAGHLKAQIWQTIDPNYINEKNERVKEIDTLFIEEENFIARAKEYFAQRNFSACRNEIQSLGITTFKLDRTTKCQIFDNLLHAYYLWDLFQHDKALNILEKTLKDLNKYRKLAEISEVIIPQIEVLHRIDALQGKEGKENLIDLYYNADRRRRSEQFVDCMTRFERLYEGVYYFLVRRDLSLEPNTKLDLQPEWIKKIIGRKNGDGHLSQYDLGRIYQEKKSQNIIRESLKNDLDQFKKLRNKTYATHGMASVTKDQANKAMKFLEKLLLEIFDSSDIDNYPFSDKTLITIGNLIFAII